MDIYLDNNYNFDNTTLYKMSFIYNAINDGWKVEKINNDEGEKYIFNLWFRECKRNQLYQEFNPEYYEKNPNKQQANTVSLPPPPPCLSNNSIEKKIQLFINNFI